jgi:hypothetical protein
MELFRGDPKIALQECGADPRRGQHGVEVTGDVGLHRDRVELQSSHRVAQTLVAPQRGASIHAQRVVHGRNDGQPDGARSEQPPTQALHIVDDVEIRAPRGELAERPHTKRKGLFEEPNPAGGELVEAKRRQHRPGTFARQKTRAVSDKPLAPELVAPHRVRRRAEGHRIESRRARKNLHAVSHRLELACEVPHIHTLAAAAHVAAVAEQCDPQGLRPAHGASSRRA